MTKLVILSPRYFPIYSSVSDLTFPRGQALNDLIHIVKKHPSLGQEAASALIELSQAIYETASASDVDILIRNTLNQEVYVRNTCLQSIQVMLTPLDRHLL